MTDILKAIDAAETSEPTYVKQERVRVICDTCGEHEAVKQHCYVLAPPYRAKPATAYSSDYNLFQCSECDELDIEDDVPALHKWNCSFERGKRFDHLFWETRSTPLDLNHYPELKAEIERLRARAEELDEPLLERVWSDHSRKHMTDLSHFEARQIFRSYFDAQKQGEET